jgi:hypothetical protein
MWLPWWVSEPNFTLLAAAGPRTVAAGTARIFYAWAGAPVPEARELRAEGVADFAARRARVAQVMLPGHLASEFAADAARQTLASELSEPTETIYDGANSYLHVGDSWTGFFLGDPAGPSGQNDPLWPLDALFGARGDGAALGAEVVRGAATTRFRLTIDLGRADTALTAGISVPAGPYRALSRLPAEVWVDDDGRARRIAVSTDLVPSPGDVQIWAVLELWDFGLAVDIAVPRPDEIVAPRVAFEARYGSEA